MMPLFARVHLRRMSHRYSITGRLVAWRVQQPLFHLCQLRPAMSRSGVAVTDARSRCTAGPGITHIVTNARQRYVARRACAVIADAGNGKRAGDARRSAHNKADYCRRRCFAAADCQKIVILSVDCLRYPLCCRGRHLQSDARLWLEPNLIAEAPADVSPRLQLFERHHRLSIVPSKTRKDTTRAGQYRVFWRYERRY